MLRSIGAARALPRVNDLSHPAANQIAAGAGAIPLDHEVRREFVTTRVHLAGVPRDHVLLHCARYKRSSHALQPLRSVIYRRHGNFWRRYYRVETPQQPTRPLGCGEFRFWDGNRCVDVRFR
jgi:hypothetical protein